MIKEAIKKLVAGNDLTFDEAAQAATVQAHSIFQQQRHL